MWDSIKEYILNYELVLMNWGIFTIAYILFLISQLGKRVKRMFKKTLHTEVETIGISIVGKIRWTLNRLMFIVFIAITTTFIISIAFN